MSIPTDTIPLTRIKGELANMWHEVTRSSVLTLVAFAPTLERAAEVQSSMAALAGQHPSRAIIAAVVPAAASATPAATVELRSHAQDHSNSMIGSEVVTLYVPATEVEHLPEYVRPLLLSDMPVFVWLTAAPPNNLDLIEALANLGDHLVFDSVTFGQPARDLGVLAHIIRRSRTTVNYKAFHDFTWERLAPWREAVAQCFDPPNLALLGQITQVRLGYAQPTTQALQPLPSYLFAGWLAARLRWQPARFTQHLGGGAQISVQMGKQREQLGIEIAPYAHPLSQTLLPGTLLFVDIVANDGGERVLFRSALAEDGTHSITTITRLDGTHAPPRAMPITTPDEATLLAEQLNRLRFDHIYEDAVLAAQALLGASPTKENMHA
jgi:glucose-6-phosphate dehydrogenase assembly protein OpcA